MKRNGRPRIVLLGMMTRFPVAGVVWQTLHYLLGFKDLGFDVYYVEAYGRRPSMLITDDEHDGSRAAAGFIAGVMAQHGLGDRWAYHALHADGAVYGMSREELLAVYRSSDLLINLHGGTKPREEHAATERLVYLETDPGELQVELHEGRRETLEFLEPHVAFFTFAENYGRPGCGLPITDRFPFLPTRQPVVMSLWEDHGRAARDVYTTVGSWRQHRSVEFEGETYFWSKHREFRRFLDLPRRSGRRFELALASVPDEDRARLQRRRWRVVDALEFSRDIHAYRRYIQQSRGEFTVAKDQNVRLRTGWFSDRAATYLASGRPVVTHDTGFSEILPTGEGLFAFQSMDDVLEALDRIEGDYETHSHAATTLARERFAHDVVLGALLEHVGVSPPTPSGKAMRPSRAPTATSATRDGATSEDQGQPFPLEMVIQPTSRRPPVLPHATLSVLETLESRTDGEISGTRSEEEKASTAAGGVSVVLVTFNQLPYTKLCLESVLANTRHGRYEVIVVDNASTDGTSDYLKDAAQRNGRVRVLHNEENVGFARACNQGLSVARGRTLVLLNNDTIVPPGWLRLIRHLRDPEVGLVGPVTNRCGNEAEIDAPYQTYGELLQFAGRQVRRHDRRSFDIRTLTMFCVAMRRDLYEVVGPLDERFELGLFEDEDYSIRVRRAGYRVVCAEDSFVHHLGQGSFGELIPTGEYGRLFEANRRRLEEKWDVIWEPYARRASPRYDDLARRLRDVAVRELPPDATVLVASRGDEGLLSIDGRRAWHFPQDEDGGYPGHYPTDGPDAIGHLETLRAKGADYLVFPATSLWWLEQYPEFRQHLDRAYRPIIEQKDTCVVYELRGERSGRG